MKPTSIAKIKAKNAIGQWQMIGTVNYAPPRGGVSGTVTVWLSGWVAGKHTAFFKDGLEIELPFLHGLLYSTITEPKVDQGEEGISQCVGAITTRLKAGDAGEEEHIEWYVVILDVFPITQRQLARRSQAGLYLRYEELEQQESIDPTPEDYHQEEQETPDNPEPPPEKPPETPEEWPKVAIRQLGKVGWTEDLLQRLMGCPQVLWDDNERDMLRVLYKETVAGDVDPADMKGEEDLNGLYKRLSR